MQDTVASSADRASSALIAGLKAPASAKAVLFALLQLKGGALVVTSPEGRKLVFGEDAGPVVDLRVKDWRFARRVLSSGDIGFAEGLMAGEWESEDLAALLTLLASNVERFTRLLEGGPVGKSLNWLRHVSRANTRGGARRNILAHYDLGNRFYEAWLDRSMTYSSARFDAHVRDLESAHRAK